MLLNASQVPTKVQLSFFPNVGPCKAAKTKKQSDIDNTWDMM